VTENDDAKAIARREGARTFARIRELEVDPVKGNFDVAHLKEVHRRIFQDLPHHAPGEFREDAPAHNKARVLESSGNRYVVPYAPRAEVDSKLSQVLKEQGGAEGMRGLSKEQFVERMAKLYGDLDYLHPFKEGNSRTLRAFTGQLAREAGRDMDWNATNADAGSRDKLYMARDREVILRKFPNLNQERVEPASLGEEKAYITLASLKKSSSLKEIIAASVDESENHNAAKAFLSKSPEAALKSHPDLAGAYTALELIKKQTKVDGLEEKQSATVLDMSRQKIANKIEQGERPDVKVKEESETKDNKPPSPGR
jgi:cell filamentation protein